jgi:hypothetical protein
VARAVGTIAEQPFVAQAVRQQRKGDERQQQRGQHLRHVAPHLEQRGDPGPQPAADGSEQQRGDEDERSGAREASRGIGAEAGADEQLSLLADVDQPGARGGDRADGDEQQRRHHRQRQPPRAGGAEAPVE